MPISITQVQAGDVVFIERPIDARGSDGTPASNYEAGEYVVIAKGESVLRCIKPGSGYDMHQTKTFCVIGRDRWEIASVSCGKAVIEEMLRVAEDFAVEGARGEGNRNWVGHVYSDTRGNAKRLVQIYRERFGRLPDSIGDKQAPELVGDGIVVAGTFYRCPPNHHPELVRDVAECKK